MPTPGLICFDLGRVLVRICDNWSEAFEAAGLRELAPVRLDPTTRNLAGAVHALELGQIDVDDFASRSAQALGVEITALAAVVDAFVHGPYPGAAALLDRIAGSGLPTACLSNTNARHWQLMNAWAVDGRGLLARLSYRFASHLLGACKPDPVVYAHVETETGVSPERIVFFDDLEVNVASARERGWQAFRIVTGNDPIAQIDEQLGRLGLGGGR
jgi:FMN phosphatase YigB (HAD superfamily)